MILETQRLIIRNITQEDFAAWHGILSDPETMAHYPAPFTEEKVRSWIEWSLKNYHDHGFGLWAVILKETGEFIGDCGITLQDIDGEMLPEVGYHIHRAHQRRGYASEAASACIRYAFEHFDFPAIYSYMKYTNAASYKTALKCGLTFIKEYSDPINTFTHVYRITRKELQEQ